MIKTDRISLTYRLIFQSAFHCGTGRPEGLLDRTVLKDKDGYLYISGSAIKGVLRESCEHIAKIYEIPVRDPHDEDNAVYAFTDGPDIVERIFGSRFKASEVFFDNAYMIEKDFFDGRTKEKKYLFLQTETRTQASISRLTGIAKDQHLFTSEFGIPFLAFEGKIHGCLEGIDNELSELPGTYPLFLLIAGIYYTNRIGGNKSTGMGRCQIEIESLSVNNQKEAPEQYCRELEYLMLYKDAKEEQ